MKTLITSFLAILVLLTVTGKAHGEELPSKPSARFEARTETKHLDQRALILQGYLEQYNSPLAPFAKDFVENADKYSLDWRLLPAISGLESYFGQRIPYNSYNGWGWGVYGTNVIRFSNWDEGIETISKALREKYLKDKVESDPYFIGPTYAASPTWAQRVSFFMERIEDYKVKNAKSRLALAL